MSNTAKRMVRRTCQVALIVAACEAAAAGRAFARDAPEAPYPIAQAPAPETAPKAVCCRVSLQFLVDGQLVSNASVMAFDTKARSVAVDSPAPGWNFHFSLTPSSDKQTLRWASSVDVAGRVIQAWTVTAAMKDPQTFTTTDASTHKTFSTVARAMVLVVPTPNLGKPRPAPTPGTDPQSSAQ